MPFIRPFQFFWATLVFLPTDRFRRDIEPKDFSRDEDPDPVIFGPPDPVLFSTDPDPTFKNGFIELFLS